MATWLFFVMLEAAGDHCLSALFHEGLPNDAVVVLTALAGYFSQQKFSIPSSLS